jgi:hypothetical protein
LRPAEKCARRARLPRRNFHARTVRCVARSGNLCRRWLRILRDICIL